MGTALRIGASARHLDIERERYLTDTVTKVGTARDIKLGSHRDSVCLIAGDVGVSGNRYLNVLRETWYLWGSAG